jgi:RND superfamily putative drug exporter
MLASWGLCVYRFRWWVLIISVLSLVPAVWLTSQGGHLESAMIPGNTESARALDLVKKELPPSLPSFGLIFRSPALRADDPAFGEEVQRAVEPLCNDPRVASVRTAYDGAVADPGSISRDGHGTTVKVELKDYTASQMVQAMDIYPELRAKVSSDKLEVIAFGTLPNNHDVTVIGERDARHTEMWLLPLVGLLLLFVFGSLLGAALPLAVGLLAVTAGIAGTLALARVTPVLVFAQNVVVMVGLGVAIDYSLFILSRFREDVHRRPVPDALAHTLATTGKAILFSGGTVAIGLFGMLFMGLGNLSSMGLAGAIVVILAVLYALTFLPALLAVLGPRVDTWKLPLINPVKAGRCAGFWHRLVTWVMAHPWQVLLPAALFLVLLGVPFMHIQLSSDVTELPDTAESRRGIELLRSEFQRVETNPILIVVRYPDGYSPLSVEHVQRIYDLSRWLSKLPAVNRVESIVDLDPSISRRTYLQMFTPPMPPLPKGVQTALEKLVGKDIVVLVAQTSLSEGSPEALSLVRTIRKSHPPVGGEFMVTGESAFQADFTQAISENSPFVVGLIVFVTYSVLFLLFGSLLLPLKAVLMNMLSISASYGALVWIFQYGYLASWLHFTPGPIESVTPIMMFCILFGLSMDYEVLLLKRVSEEYDKIGDNTRAVALGLERTGRTITGAAAIMALVLFAFGFADLRIIKTMGIGMGIAIVVDATIVRCLLVPATMRLLGRWNWWAPGPMARLYELFALGQSRRVQYNR